MTDRRNGIATAVVLALLAGGCSGGGGGGTAPLTCEPPFAQCGTGCANVLADAANCGACGRACAPGAACTNGACVAPCGTGFQRCDGVCTSLATDEGNCGACGNACGAGELCAAGVCGPTCTAGAPTRCGAACMNLQTDDANCGACGVACSAGLHCRSGVCTDACPLYEAKCGGGVCASTGTDDANCGACGVVCDAGEACSGGACVATCSGTIGLPGLPLAAAGTGMYGAESMASGDLDGDGDVDFAFAAGSSVVVLKSVGDGRFAAPQAIALGNSVADVVLADLSGDGRPDVLATSSFDAVHDLVVLLNDGSGGFGAPVRYDTAPGVRSAGPTGIAVADFDGDGRLDVAVSNTYASNVAVFLNQGAGALSATPAITAVDSSGYDWIAAGDLGGDGKPDLALAGSSTIRVLTNTGNGTFNTAVSYPPWSSGLQISPERLGIADVDGDGRNDLAFAERGALASAASVLWNGATNPFTTRTQVPIASSNVYSVALGDVDGDGRLDLVVPRYEGMLSVARNAGGRTFGTPMEYSVGSSPELAAIVDVDGDGVVDLATPRGDALALLHGNGDGTFVAPLRQQLSGMDVSKARLADLNGDGRLDVVVISRQKGQLGYAFGNGDGTFGALVVRASPGAPSDVAVGDLNGDGRPEIVVAKYGDYSVGNSGVSVLVNDGTGAFADEVLYGIAASIGEVALGDLNEDGKLDVVVSDWSGIDIRLGNGDGTLAGDAAFGMSSYTLSAFAIADLDGDGRQDLVASVLDSGTDWLLSFRNKGGATLTDRFQNSQTGKVQTLEYALDLAIADVDGDGRPDVLLAEQSQGLGVYRNLGAGQLASRVAADAAYTSRLAVTDLDGDRHADVLSYGAATGQFSLLRGQGGGVLAAPVAYGTAGGAPMVGDLNGDGRVDVATMGASMGVHLTTCR